MVMRDVGNTEVAGQFADRWSSRSYDGSLLTREEIEVLLEAARWTPSSYNEQPWKFYYPHTEKQRQVFLSLLVEGNQEWAKHAGIIFFLAAKRMLDRTGKQNKHYAFDTGAAWMSFALQAHLRGLNAHAMGGFDEERAYDVLGIPKDAYELFAAIAVGKPTPEAEIMEERTSRKSFKEISKKVI